MVMDLNTIDLSKWGQNVKDFGVTGDGTTYDDTKLQRAIEVSQRNGDILLIPAGNYKLGDTLHITSHISILGSGYQGDSGLIYKHKVLTNTNNFLGTTLLPPKDKTCLNIFTNDAVQLSSFMIMWPQVNWPQFLSGVSGIQIQCTDGNNANTDSLIEKLYIYGADRSITTINASTITISKCRFVMSQTYGLVIHTLEGYEDFKNGGDWLVEDNTFYSGTAYTGGGAAIYIMGSAGKITNNKIQPSAGSGRNSSGILVCPDASVKNRIIEPLQISDNSIEGNTYGIRYYQNAPSDAMAVMNKINDNQIWCDTPIKVETNGNYSVRGLPNGTWVNDLTVDSNTLQVNVNGGTAIDLDGVQSADITNNSCSITGSFNNGTAVSFGRHTFKSNIDSSNKISSGMNRLINYSNTNSQS